MTSKERGLLAEKYFLEGYNCSQSVAMAFADLTELDIETLKRIAIPFGGGIGRLREVCGAVSGMCIVLGLLHGEESKAQVYERVQKVANEFKKEFGSYVCKDLLGKPGAEKPQPAERTKEYYTKRPCSECVKKAAEILSNNLL